MSKHLALDTEEEGADRALWKENGEEEQEREEQLGLYKETEQTAVG